MILHPDPAPARDDGVISAWSAVARLQATKSAQCQLVHQPAHARLSGELVQRFSLPHAPALSEDVVRAIALHDEGWADFDSGSRKLQATRAHYTGNIALNDDGKPLTFIEIEPGDFLDAWRISIENVESIAPIAGLLVSRHFHSLGQFGLASGHYSNDDAELVRTFLGEEDGRQQRLLKLEKRPPQEIAYWTDMLRFCDLLSLYLCCGSRANAEFPQKIGPAGETITLRWKDDVYVSTPSLFAEQQEFSVPARSFPAGVVTKLTWKLR